MQPVAYGGFFRRASACVLDRLLLAICVGVVLAIVGLAGGPQPKDLFDLLPAGRLCYTAFYFLLTATIFAAFESSDMHATPAKYLIGLRVFSDQGTPLSFQQAFLRNCCRLLTIFTLGIGYLMVFVTKRKQTLHDKISHCLVFQGDKTLAYRIFEWGWMAVMLVAIIGIPFFLISSGLLGEHKSFAAARPAASSPGGNDALDEIETRLNRRPAAANPPALTDNREALRAFEEDMRTFNAQSASQLKNILARIRGGERGTRLNRDIAVWEKANIEHAQKQHREIELIQAPAKMKASLFIAIEKNEELLKALSQKLDAAAARRW